MVTDPGPDSIFFKSTVYLLVSDIEPHSFLPNTTPNTVANIIIVSSIATRAIGIVAITATVVEYPSESRRP